MEKTGRLIRTLSMGLVAGLLTAQAAMAGQASSYTETNLVEGQCEQNAAQAAAASRFTDIVTGDPSVTFRSGPYECGARCIVKHNIVFFYCVGPQDGYAHDVVEGMKKHGQWMR